MHYFKHTYILLFVSFLAFTSCSKDNEAPSTKAIIQQGKWKIVLFNDNGSVETSDYSGYEFTFNTNGSITVVRNGSTITGNWNVGADESLNKLTLSFPLLTFTELSEQWTFLEKSYSLIKLEHVNSDGQTEVLVFQKI